MYVSQHIDFNIESFPKTSIHRHSPIGKYLTFALSGIPSRIRHIDVPNNDQTTALSSEHKFTSLLLNVKPRPWLGCTENVPMMTTTISASWP